MADVCHIMKGKKATGYPTCVEQIAKDGGEIVDEDVVVDGNLITSRGPTISLDFSVKLMEVLAGKEKAAEVVKKTLYIYK